MIDVSLYIKFMYDMYLIYVNLFFKRRIYIVRRSFQDKSIPFVIFPAI